MHITPKVALKVTSEVTPKNTPSISETAPERAMSWTEREALETRDIVEAIKDKMKAGESVYDILTYTIKNELDKNGPIIAEAIANYMLKNSIMPTADQVAEITGQPKYYCDFIILQAGDRISELVAKTGRGQSGKSILYETTTRKVENTKWVYHDYPSGKAENYIWDDDYYRRSADGHYETTYKTIKEKNLRVNVYPTPLHRLKRIFNKEKVGEITPQVLDEILAKHFPL